MLWKAAYSPQQKAQWSQIGLSKRLELGLSMEERQPHPGGFGFQGTCIWASTPTPCFLPGTCFTAVGLSQGQ